VVETPGGTRPKTHSIRRDHRPRHTVLDGIMISPADSTWPSAKYFGHLLGIDITLTTRKTFNVALTTNAKFNTQYTTLQTETASDFLFECLENTLANSFPN